MNINAEYSNFQSFSSLEPIAEQAKVNLSFWGCRYLTFLGYEGTLPLDAVAQRVTEIIRKNSDFNVEERFIGQKLSHEINRIYEDINNLVNHSNFITWAFACIRDFHFPSFDYLPNYYCSEMRWLWKDIEKCDFSNTESSCHKFDNPTSYSRVFFEYYTKKQYQAQFNKKPAIQREWDFDDVCRYKHIEN